MTDLVDLIRSLRHDLKQNGNGAVMVNRHDLTDAVKVIDAERALADDLAAVLERLDFIDPDGTDDIDVQAVLARYREARR